MTTSKHDQSEQPTDAAKGQTPQASSPESRPEGQLGTQGGDAELDFESLDLSIEAVDERISPSETNVFDK